MNTRQVVLAATLLGVVAAGTWAPPAAAEMVKRAVPDYDGRADDDHTAEEVLLWIPRLLLSPLYFFNEYMVRRPLGYALTEAERAGLGDLIAEMVGSESKLGVSPTVLVDFGFRTSIGAYFYWDDAGVDGHSLRARMAFGGLEWWRVTLKERYAWDWGRHLLGWRADYIHRPDYLYSGIGWDIDLDDTARWGRRQLQAAIYYRLLWTPLMGLETHAWVRNYKHTRPTCCGPSLDRRIGEGRLQPPPEYKASFTFFEQELVGFFDTRRALREDGHQFRAEVTVAGGVELADTERAWVRYGARVGGWFDLGLPNRVLGIDMAVDFADPLGDIDVPSTRLARLGGPGPLRAFPGDALIGRSAIALTASYRWPIWFWWRTGSSRSCQGATKTAISPGSSRSR